VCVNDQMEDPSPELQKVFKDFFLSFFPFHSQFELPPGTRNPTLYYDEYMSKYSPEASTVNSLLRAVSMARDGVLKIGWHVKTAWRGLVREVYEMVEGETHPRSTLDAWASGRRPTRVYLDSQESGGAGAGVRVFLPYWVLVLSAGGLLCLWGLRKGLRRPVRRQHYVDESGEVVECVVEERGRADTDVESRIHLAGPLGRGAAIDYERKRYYSFQSQEEATQYAQSAGPDADLLNSLWRTVGYGSTGEKGKEDGAEEMKNVRIM
jgi:hypothetical protein